MRGMPWKGVHGAYRQLWDNQEDSRPDGDCWTTRRIPGQKGSAGQPGEFPARRAVQDNQEDSRPEGSCGTTRRIPGHLAIAGQPGEIPARWRLWDNQEETRSVEYLRAFGMGLHQRQVLT